MKKRAIFTCDTEFTPPWHSGSWGNQERETFKEGLRNIKNILAQYGVRGTFYCQGVMVEEFPEIIRDLAKVHLIGSHGYNHENYGGRLQEAFFTEEAMPLGDKEKKLELLERCKDVHKRIVGYSPEVFCAPFNSIDCDLLSILEKTGFKVDSSFNNYRLGLPSKLFKPESFDLFELPFSVIRFEGLGYKNVLQALTYDYKKISDVMRQETIVITCHPYEFIDIKIPHPAHVQIVGDRKTGTLERLIQDLLKDGYEFTDPLQLLEKTRQLSGVH
ncbi:polysaccharide deacetylase family protein [Candidatus Omnitrophota bacterium]